MAKPNKSLNWLTWMPLVHQLWYKDVYEHQIYWRTKQQKTKIVEKPKSNEQREQKFIINIGVNRNEFMETNKQTKLPRKNQNNYNKEEKNKQMKYFERKLKLFSSVSWCK